MKEPAGCYFCGGVVTSREHVPPLGFFPKTKDTVDRATDYRRSLLTVGSCSLHNLSYSNDDEIAGLIIQLAYDNNHAAAQQFKTKGIRSLVRNDAALAIRVFKSFTPIIVDGHETAAAELNVEPLNNVLDKIGRALFFKDIEECFLGELIQVPLDMLLPDLSQTPATAVALKEYVPRFEKAPKRGENPDIFTYQTILDINNRIAAYLLTFYEGFRVILFMKQA